MDSMGTSPSRLVEFRTCSVTFHPDDFCGRSLHDATELSKIVQNVKDMTQQNQVNIVAHSKGGLDARLYLSRSNTSDVKNLIMIVLPTRVHLLQIIRKPST